MLNTVFTFWGRVSCFRPDGNKIRNNWLTLCWGFRCGKIVPSNNEYSFIQIKVTIYPTNNFRLKFSIKCNISNLNLGIIAVEMATFSL